MNLKNAEAITQHVIARIGKFCEIVSPAGSVRRQCNDVKDIDFVLIPKKTFLSAADLFGADSSTTILSNNFISSIKSLGKFTKGKPDGKHLQAIVWNAKVDFFMPDPWDYYRILCIRTGSQEYIKRVIGPAWRRLGWCGTDFGLRRIEDCKVFVESTGKRRFELLNKSGEIPPPWQSEEHFFEWLHVPYMAPQKRDFY
jgi:DNA polymerase/3'-5' exonuclease PolX